MRCDEGDQPPTYRVLDNQGRLIGRVRLSRGQLPLGRGAGTVLLVRERNPVLATRGGGRSPDAPAARPG